MDKEGEGGRGVGGVTAVTLRSSVDYYSYSISIKHKQRVRTRPALYETQTLARPSQSSTTATAQAALTFDSAFVLTEPA